MKWCNLMQMWCSDMDEEDIENADCDGDCKNCWECKVVASEVEYAESIQYHELKRNE